MISDGYSGPARRALGLAGGGSLLAASIGAGLALAAAPAGASTFTVTTLDDAGTGSLRQAIIDANNSPTDDVIDFAPGLGGTISLTTGRMLITDEVSITGPGASAITVDAQGASQIFYIYDGGHVGAVEVSISGLTLTNGTATSAYGGGAIAAWSSNLTLADMVISDSVSTTRGGAVMQGYSANGEGRDATLTILTSTFSGNSSTTNGGALALYAAGEASISGSVFEDNTAGGQGGAIYSGFAVGSFSIEESRLSGNTATNGGAIRVQAMDDATKDTTLTYVSVVDNTSTGTDAAALSFDHTGASVQIRESTVSDNAGGGIVGFDATMMTTSYSTVSGNSGVGIMSVNRGMNVSSSIVADNALDLGSDADVRYSLVETGGTSIVAGDNNIIGVDPGLQPLLEHDSLIWVHPILETSAAFNAGSVDFEAPPFFDQTGNDRVSDGRIDIGAFEFQVVPEPSTTTTSGDDPVTPTFAG